jgi:hypothetical protein
MPVVPAGSPDHDRHKLPRGRVLPVAAPSGWPRRWRSSGLVMVVLLPRFELPIADRRIDPASAHPGRLGQPCMEWSRGGKGQALALSRQASLEVPVGQERDQVTLPSQVDGDAGLFDRFAGNAAAIASRAPFFAFCVLLIVVWAPSVLVVQFDTWQLIINTATTIVTFLMVALLQNSQTRSDEATQHKLNAVADGLADLMHHFADQDQDPRLHQDIEELKLAVGLETRETTSGASSSRTGSASRAEQPAAAERVPVSSRPDRS